MDGATKRQWLQETDFCMDSRHIHNCLRLQGGRWRQCVPEKHRRICTRLSGFTSEKTVISTVTAVITSNLTVARVSKHVRIILFAVGFARLGVRIPREARDCFFLLETVRTGYVTQPASCSIGTVVFFAGVMRLGREVNQLPPSSVEARNGGDVPLLPLYAFRMLIWKTLPLPVICGSG